jgi:NAD+ diphosphatase
MTAPETPAPPARVGLLDRAGDERTTPGLVETLRADPRTRVLLARADATLVDVEGGLLLTEPAQVPADAEWAFLGRDDQGRALLVAALEATGDTPSIPGGTWAPLRAIGGVLPAGDAGALVTAVALGRWLRDAAHCPACGARTNLRNAGWSRSCPSCGREHFPRTDPAVIVAVARDDDQALLLGANAAWGGERYSCFAGFVEAGESLEDTVAREVREEAGIGLTDVRYAGSQGWPYPRSLMLGFVAVAAVGETATADGDEIVDVRWFSRDEIGDALAGRGGPQLPGSASIARRLIEAWHAGRA